MLCLVIHFMMKHLHDQLAGLVSRSILAILPRQCHSHTVKLHKEVSYNKFCTWSGSGRVPVNLHFTVNVLICDFALWLSIQPVRHTHINDSTQKQLVHIDR